MNNISIIEKFSKNNMTNKMDWFLVKKDGSRCIKPFEKNIKKTFKAQEDELQEMYRAAFLMV